MNLSGLLELEKLPLPSRLKRLMLSSENTLKRMCLKRLLMPLEFYMEVKFFLLLSNIFIAILNRTYLKNIYKQVQ
jgi:hypothetical protein